MRLILTLLVCLSFLGAGCTQEGGEKAKRPERPEIAEPNIQPGAAPAAPAPAEPAAAAPAPAATEAPK